MSARDRQLQVADLKNRVKPVGIEHARPEPRREQGIFC